MSLSMLFRLFQRPDDPGNFIKSIAGFNIYRQVTKLQFEEFIKNQNCKSIAPQE